MVPVVIDETSYDEETVPEAFRQAHWIHLPDGNPTDELVKRVRDLYRRYNKEQEQGLR